MTTSTETTRSTAAAAPPTWLSARLYAKLWRLHFYAGIILTPLVLWLCVTGILYILSPQIEAVLYRDLLTVRPGGLLATFDQQLAAAKAAYPDLVATGFHPSKGPGHASYVSMTTPEEARMVGMRHGGPTESIAVYVNPHTATVLGSLREEDRYSHSMGNWHGNLYLGSFGRLLTELGTMWTLALLLTGLYLWFPKRPGLVWGVWLTRLRGAKGRVWWRDFHSVGGMYTALLIAAFLVTALMISLSTGTAFALARVALGQNVPMAPRSLKSVPDAAATRVQLQDLSAVATMAGFERYMVSLPRSGNGLYTISADNGMGRPQQRLDVSVDQYRGAVVHQSGWAEYPWLLKLTVIGLGFHFGALFGVVGQVLGIVACLAPIFFIVSGFVMWWKRKPAHAWGLPRATEGTWKPFPRGLIAIVAVLSLLMPTFGASLLLALAVDAALLRITARRAGARVSSGSLGMTAARS